MKRSFLIFTLGSGVSLLSLSCNDNASSKTEANSMDTVNNMTTTASKMAVDSNTTTLTSNEFVTKAASGGMMEVELGKFAQVNSSRGDIKDYGKMLEADHSQGNATLQSIATAEHISIPASMNAQDAMHVKDLEAKKGTDFDKAYILMMIDDHNKDIAEFKEAANSNPNAKVKDFATKTLPVLEKHLANAKMIKTKMK